jgi:general secretion pathway protein K
MRNEQLTLGKSGAALILVLLMISILVVLVVETMRSMQVEEVGARYFQKSLKAEALAKSGIHLAMALLATDGELAQEDEKNDVDHPGESWALLPQPDSLPTTLPDFGTLEGQVIDESGKFPINSLVNDEGALEPAYQQVLEKLLTNTGFSMEPEEATGLVMAIKDWLDKDDEPTGEFGAEADYYQTLEKPRECKNGLLTSLAELQLVRGMDPSLYFGKEGEPGLKDLLTIHSDGKININTAGSLVLQALVSAAIAQETAAEWAESAIAYRQEPMHWEFLSESDWYRNRMAGYNDISLPAELITTRSSYFSVQMTGKVGVGRKSIFAYLERRTEQEEEAKGVRVLVRFWQVY